MPDNYPLIVKVEKQSYIFWW